MLLSDFLDALYEKVQGLGKHRYWLLLLVLVFVTITLINGLGIVPEAPYQRLSQNPFTTRTDIHFNNYWQESPLLPIIAFYLDLTGTITFNALTFAIILAAYTLFAWLTYHRWGPTISLIASTLLITSPLTTILLSWLGTPDGLTVALTIPFLFTRSGILMLFLAILGTANHPAFIIATLEIIILRWAAREGIKFRHVLLALIGWIAGYGAVKLFLYSNGIGVVSRFDFMQLKTMSEWIKMNLQILPISLFSLFNLHWAVLAVCTIMFFKRDRRFFSLVVLALLINYGLVFFTLDTTRVFVLISWGVLITCLFHAYKLASSSPETDSLHQKQFLQALMLVSIVSFFSPHFFSWAGEIHVSPFYKIIERLMQ